MIEVLVVDDQRSDIVLLRRALRRLRVQCTVHEADSGTVAMNFLRSNKRAPDLILLDLNMPNMGGREVLGELLADSDLRKIPVVVMTTSDDDSDVAAAYDLKAAAYFVKPSDPAVWYASVENMVRFWFGCVTYPKKERP